MEFIKNFPFFTIIISLISSVVCSIISHKAARRFSLFSSLSVLSLSVLTLIYSIQKGESFIYIMGHFSAPWGNEIRIGVLEALFAVLFTAILLLSVRGGLRHLYEDLCSEKINLYYVMVNLIQAALLALVYTNDIFTGYVFIEICTLASAGLLMIRETGRTTIAAVRYMIFNLLGSGLFLMGIIILYDITGHLLMENIREAILEIVDNGQYMIPLTISVALILIGLGIKSGLFPFFFWMPDTYGCATVASSSIISGIISKGYIFLLLKIIYRVFGFDIISKTNILELLFVFGLLGMIIGSICAIKENNILKMVAFSSAAQIGYIYMGIGLGTQTGIVAAVFHIIAHAITKPMLFISSSGLIDASDGNKQFSALQGSFYRNRIAGLSFIIGSVSMVGVPVFAGFISKMLFAFAGFGLTNKTIPTLIALAISTILNSIYFLRTSIRIVNTQDVSTDVKIRLKDQKSYTLIIIIFVLLNVFVGLHPQPIIDLIETGLAMF